MFEPNLQPPSIPEGLLQEIAPAIRAQIRYERGAADSDLQRAVLEQTAEEVSGKGWLKGPYTEQEVSERLGAAWIPNRRFGIQQSGKVRLIDDLSASRVNAAFGKTERPRLLGLDHLPGPLPWLCPES